MKNEIQHYKEPALEIERIFEEEKLQTLLQGKERVKLQNFQRLLFTDPWQHERLSGYILEHPIHGSPYLPIGVIETLLDEIFFGLWSVEVIDQRQILNEILITVTLTVTHPVTGQELRRSGVGACAIQQDSGAKPDQIERKKTRALEKDAPHAYSTALKNAAQRFGRIFGRDIGRVDTAREYNPVIDSEKAEGIKKSLDDILAERKKKLKETEQSDES